MENGVRAGEWVDGELLRLRDGLCDRCGRESFGLLVALAADRLQRVRRIRLGHRRTRAGGTRLTIARLSREARALAIAFALSVTVFVSVFVSARSIALMRWRTRSRALPASRIEYEY